MEIKREVARSPRTARKSHDCKRAALFRTQGEKAASLAPRQMFICSVTIMKTEPTTCCDGQQANQNDQRGEPPVWSGPANSPKPLLGASKSSNAVRIGHDSCLCACGSQIKSLACIVF